MSEFDEFYEVALELVKDAGKIVKSKMFTGKSSTTKSCEIDLVTETDKQVEKLLIDGITAKFPNHKFVGEESTSAKIELTDDPTWIIDPIDGTMNFVHNFPMNCISVGCMIKKAMVIGIVYNPTLELLFTAKKGQGAFMNGEAIHVSKETDLKKSLVMFEMGTSREVDKVKNVQENLNKILNQVHGIRSIGSAALNMCMVAMGSADVNFEFGIHAWDIAAGYIIVKETGGVCLDPSGEPLDLLSRRVLCASSMELAMQFSKILVQYYPERD